MIKPGKMVREVLKSLFLKPATILYPYVHVQMPDRFRGKIKFISSRCIGCKLCMRDCPTNAITITKVGDKQFQAEFDLDKCVYCAQCVDTCPKKALEATVEFELAQLKRGKLKVTFHAEPMPSAAPAAIAESAATSHPAAGA
ncbi:MAG: 4Fe-4S binding protein [Kiritimatiellae bacterium]|nr:4Fe-4S binding protein [Kiritimatiellia bacterium]